MVPVLSIIGLVAVVVLLVVYGIVIVRIFSAFKDKPGPVKTAWNVFLLVLVVALPLVAFYKIQNPPPANSIDTQLEVSDADGQLTLESIYMAAPDYESGEGLLAKRFTSELVVNVKNTSDEDTYLGVEYYVNAGSLGFYSPGAINGLRKVQVVPAEWEGELKFSIRHFQFVKGGTLTLRLYKCTALEREAGTADSDELLFKETFDMVAKP